MNAYKEGVRQIALKQQQLVDLMRQQDPKLFGDEGHYQSEVFCSGEVMVIRHVSSVVLTRWVRGMSGLGINLAAFYHCNGVDEPMAEALGVHSANRLNIGMHTDALTLPRVEKWITNFKPGYEGDTWEDHLATEYFVDEYGNSAKLVILPRKIVDTRRDLVMGRIPFYDKHVISMMEFGDLEMVDMVLKDIQMGLAVPAEEFMREFVTKLNRDGLKGFGLDV